MCAMYRLKGTIDIRLLVGGLDATAAGSFISVSLPRQEQHPHGADADTITLSCAIPLLLTRSATKPDCSDHGLCGGTFEAALVQFLGHDMGVFPYAKWWASAWEVFHNA